MEALPARLSRAQFPYNQAQVTDYTALFSHHRCLLSIGNSKPEPRCIARHTKSDSNRIQTNLIFRNSNMLLVDPDPETIESHQPIDEDLGNY